MRLRTDDGSCKCRMGWLRNQVLSKSEQNRGDHFRLHTQPVCPWCAPGVPMVWPGACRRVAATVADTSQPVASKKSLWKHVNAHKQKCEHLEE